MLSKTSHTVRYHTKWGRNPAKMSHSLRFGTDWDLIAR